MKCEQIQPNLLDYSNGRLSRPESEQVREHIAECAECAALLEEEIVFARQLSSIPIQQPSGDVWKKVQAATKPKHAELFVTLGGFMRSGYRKAAAAMIVAMLLLAAIYNFAPINNQPVTTPAAPSQTVQVKWSDDPMGTQTDAMIDFVDSM